MRCVLLCLAWWPVMLFSQQSLEFDAATVKAYTPYLESLHKGPESLTAFKIENPHSYLLELWYFSKSFYIRKKDGAQGPRISIGMIDVRRFEFFRNETSEVVIPLQGFCEEAVLIPTNQLLYKLP